VNYSFVDSAGERDFAGNDNPVRLLNPIASQMNVMRSTLAGSLVANVVYNVNRKLDRVRLFEIGKVYVHDTSVVDGPLTVAGICQTLRVGAIAYGDAVTEQWGVKPARSVDFYDLKRDLENLLAPAVASFIAAPHPALHPGRAARIHVAGREVGWIGELHPRHQQRAELPRPAILFELDAEVLANAAVPHFSEVSKFPAVTRDIALVVAEEVSAGDMLDALRMAGGSRLTSVELFDLYRGKGVPENKKSLAFRVVMQDTERTLTDSEVDAEVARLVQILVGRFGGTLRA
jgi:phenylalanyl-tRNA synthetase beta chain